METLEDILGRLDMTRIPRHVAMIMDGNGRWAKNRDKVRSDGHYEGITSVHNVTALSSDLGMEYLTLYAFSTENWIRPKEE
ncbi:MAG: undecaprenyl diphosphate synthase family protein, partial [Muribaculaceae bacterium]|nr:undecaprenyl diphosphate synthase family protein [Muribaculaceae bacterium]